MELLRGFLLRIRPARSASQQQQQPQQDLAPFNFALDGEEEDNALEPSAAEAESEAFRNINISACLARQCSVVQGLIDMLGNKEDSGPADDGSMDSAAVAASPFPTVTVPGVPASVPQRGLKLLDAWAQQQQQALAGGQSLAEWLPRFLAEHFREVLGPAARAADFLGCQAFQDLVLHIQLLRWVLRGGFGASSGAGATSSSAGRSGNGNRVGVGASSQPRDPKAPLTEEELRFLPCLQQQEPQQPQQTVERPTGQSGPSDALGPQQLPQSPQVLPRRLIPVEQFEKVVSELYDNAGLTNTSAQIADIRRYLHALGFIPSWSCVVQGERSHQNGKVPYATLAVKPLTGDVGYEVAAVEVEAESHDQGWSSYPADRNSTRNSWTWGELLLEDPYGNPVHVRHQAGTGGSSERPRLFTNLHAVDRWQTHVVRLGPDSGFVRDLQGCIAAASEADATAAGTATAVAAEAGTAVAGTSTAASGGGAEDGGSGSGGVPEEGQGAGGSSSSSSSSGPGRGGGGGEYRIRLLMCAAFPGWTCYMRSGRIRVELRPL